MYRRRFLATGAATVSLGVVGCTNVLDQTEEFTDASLHQKRIHVEWENRGGRDATHFTYITQITRDGTALVGSVATEIEDIVRSLTTVYVDDAIRTQWRDAFEEIRYIVLIDLGDENGKETQYDVSAELFNDVQFDDLLHVRRSSDDTEIHERVASGGEAPIKDDIQRYEFADVHDSSNPPAL